MPAKMPAPTPDDDDAYVRQYIDMFMATVEDMVTDMAMTWDDVVTGMGMGDMGMGDMGIDMDDL